jgi:N-acetylglucosamine-6-phosphate deacetylase
VPRPKTKVKNKLPKAGIGAVDLHFHGAFGVDLMRATDTELDSLSEKLWQAGVSAFCPTTLTAPAHDLQAAVERLGHWIHRDQAPGAIPLGIHLEGPFISPHACGAHPPGIIRPFDWNELEALWKASQQTLKILTIAPETLRKGELSRLAAWSRKRGVKLSLGHSQATQEQAEKAFKGGFSGVTHAWNALPFHHRSPGPLGAALGRVDTHIEVILDGVHVSPTLIRWTLALHPERTCFVSDCTPAAGTADESWHSFGPLQVRIAEGASRLPNGHLAGGGILLAEAYARWVETEAKARGLAPAALLRRTLRNVTTDPLAAVDVPASRLTRRKVRWTASRLGRIQFDSVR